MVARNHPRGRAAGAFGDLVDVEGVVLTEKAALTSPGGLWLPGMS